MQPLKLFIMNTKNFKPAEGSDFDYKIYERHFSGKLTKCRYKILDSFCRKNSFHTHCGHEWDCCGCLCGQSMSFEYKHNQVTVTLTQSFNY